MVAGVFPERLKYSKVKPLHKKRVKNYPYLITDQFSLLTAFSKIFEKVIYERVNDFLNSNILASEQFGIRKSLSSDKALFNFTHGI
jgi:hypothetical protein